MYYHRTRNQEQMNATEVGFGRNQQVWRHSSLGPPEGLRDNGQLAIGGDAQLGNADSSDFLMTDRELATDRL